MADISILSTSAEPAPKEYELAGAQEIVLKGVTASFDGTAAAGAFIPAVQIIDPAGVVVGTYIAGSTLAAGASADVSWFPGVTPPAAAAAGGSGIQFNAGVYGADNVGDWSLLEATGTVGQTFTTPSAAGGGEVAYGLAITTAHGLLVTCDPALAGPLVVADQISAGDYGAQGIAVLAQDLTPNGTQRTTGIDVFAESYTDSNSTYGVKIDARNGHTALGGPAGKGNVYGVFCQATGWYSGGAATSVSTGIWATSVADAVDVQAIGATIAGFGGTNNKTVYGVQGQALSGSGGTGETRAVEAICAGNSSATSYGVYASTSVNIGAGAASAIGVFASATLQQAAMTGVAVGVDAGTLVPVLGTATEIAIRARTSGRRAGAGSVTLQCLTSAGAKVFEVRDDGTIHGKAAVGAITWDL